MRTQSRKEEQRKWQSLPQESRRAIIQRKQNLTVVDGVTYDADGNNVTHLFDIVPVHSQGSAENRARALEAIDALTEHESENGGFVFAFFLQARTIVERFPTLSQADTARLLFIGTYVAWSGGKPAYDGRLQYDNGRPISRKQLQELTGMSRPRFSEFYKRLEGEGILTEDADTKDLFMNPSVIYRGNVRGIRAEVADLEHTRVFRSTVRRLYEEFGGRKLKQLGLIYSVLPFISTQTNIVAHNPEEKDSERLRPMNVRTLAMVLEYDAPQKLKTALNAVELDGKPVFLFADDPHDRREKRIVVNPRVVFGGNNESLEAIKVLFNM